MSDLYEVLEVCLQEIERGESLETVLFRYPHLAEELRPILESSAGAKSMASPAPSAEVVRRNRARVLQHAAQMRETKVKSSRRLWFASLRRVAVTLAVVTLLFVSGTRLVSASSTTLPGDNLYPVKRTWEGVRLLLAFNAQVRDALEVEHENERLYELKELFAERRSAEVDFKGRVASQSGNEWMVAGVRVLISSQTEIRDPGIVAGSPVRVKGVTQEDGTVLAERIRLLDSDAKLPDEEDEHEIEDHSDDTSGSTTGGDNPRFEVTQTPGPESEPENSNSGMEENQDDHSSDDGSVDDNSSNDDHHDSDHKDDSGGSHDGGDD